MKRLALFLITPLILSGCITVKTQPDQSGGMYRSKDNGQTFERTASIATVGETSVSFATDNVAFMTFDPTDFNTIYYTSRESNVYVTNDGGNSWREILKNKGIVNHLLVDQSEPCHLYAQTTQNVFASNNCGRTWKTIYLEKVKNRTINDIEIDLAATNRIFMTLSDGSIQLSEDYGVSWRVWNRVENAITELFMNPKNTQIFYGITGQTLLRSTDQGASWTDLGSVIVKDFEFKNGKQVTNLVFIPEYDDGFYTTSPYGILKSPDGGASWEDLELLPQPKKDTILSLAVNPVTMDELYYGTARAIFYSRDGGVNWQTLKSPSSKRNQELLMHPQNGSILYVGVYTPPE